jgi:hypothetical protein
LAKNHIFVVVFFPAYTKAGVKPPHEIMYRGNDTSIREVLSKIKAPISKELILFNGAGQFYIGHEPESAIDQGCLVGLVTWMGAARDRSGSLSSFLRRHLGKALPYLEN